MLPVIPQREVIVFPRTIVSLVVARQRSLAALGVALEGSSKRVVFVGQRRPDLENPAPDDLYEHGTLAEIIQVIRGEEGPSKIIAEGIEEVAIQRFDDRDDCLYARTAPVTIEHEENQRTRALVRAVQSQFQRHVGMVDRIPAEVLTSVQAVEDPALLAYQVANYSVIGLERKQGVLEGASTEEKLTRLLEALQEENELRELEGNIITQVKSQIGKSQREYFLNEQIKAIERELGVNEDEQEIEDFEEAIQRTKLSKEAREKAERELSRLSRMTPLSPEATVSRTYLETLLELPWGRYTRDKKDLDRAQRILDEDHYALEKVKERIIEFLAVHSRVKAIRGPVLCLVGPPGVGKTSLARSIARTLNRKFVRVALGGVRDEAEIRGHRRTYIGSMPGKIIQSMRKAGSANPVFLLDEVDKMSSDFRGDPAAALLEVLDPEQNKQFNDHYLEIDYDLSRVLFITTANHRSGIPVPLLDRMEVIQLAGYTEEEKVGIATKFLIPKQTADHGLKAGDIELSEEALRWLIRCYTREAGVRKLEQRIASLCRKAVRRTVQYQEKLPVRLDVEGVRDMLGPPRFKEPPHDLEPEVGVATGLAWTEVGGELLQAETTVMPGKGALVLTGKLGDVMQESAKAALTYIRAHAREFEIADDFHKTRDIHVHFPEGAVPKDGPSAGVTMVSSMVSALSGRPVRQDFAMTGEINLRGKVLRIGGLKEKVLAAYRERIPNVILPEENVDDLEDVPQSVREKIEFYPVTHLGQVLERVIEEPKTKAKKARTNKSPASRRRKSPARKRKQPDSRPAATRARARE